MIRSTPLIITSLFLALYASAFNSTHKNVDFLLYSPERMICLNNGDTNSHWSRYLNSIKVSPLKLIGLANPGLEFGYERFFGRSFGTQLTLAAIAPPWANREYYVLSGFGVGIEQRLYFAQKSRHRWFTGLKASWSHVRYKAFLNYHPEEIVWPIYTKEMRVDRTISHLTPKIGYQFTKGAFIGEFGIGIGVKYRRVVHLDKIPGYTYDMDIEHINFKPSIHRESDHFEVAIPASFMIGWRF